MLLCKQAPWYHLLTRQTCTHTHTQTHTHTHKYIYRSLEQIGHTVLWTNINVSHTNKDVYGACLTSFGSKSAHWNKQARMRKLNKQFLHNTCVDGERVRVYVGSHYKETMQSGMALYQKQITLSSAALHNNPSNFYSPRKSTKTNCKTAWSVSFFNCHKMLPLFQHQWQCSLALINDGK